MARHLTTTVRSVRPLTPDVTLYELADPDDWPLPPFRAGAHIDVHLPNGMTRSYSLCSDPSQGKRWAIAVRRETPGRGGSIYCHEHMREGMTLPVSLPRNHFPLAADAGRHLFLAAGIGVTPFMAMISELERKGSDFHLHMASREPASLPFADRMAQLQAAGRASIHLSAGDPERRMPISAIVAAAAGDPQTHLYACGRNPSLPTFSLLRPLSRRIAFIASASTRPQALPPRARLRHSRSNLRAPASVWSWRRDRPSSRPCVRPAFPSMPRARAAFAARARSRRARRRAGSSRFRAAALRAGQRHDGLRQRLQEPTSCARSVMRLNRKLWRVA